MTPRVRQFLFATLITCHATVSVCGPCLHELPSFTHRPWTASGAHRSDVLAQSGVHSKDSCLVCQYVAQFQLAVEISSHRSTDQLVELLISVRDLSQPVFNPLGSNPRAPPVSGVRWL
jgi:hypothetical protein